MRKTIFVGVLVLLSIALVLAQESHDSEIEGGKKLVESSIRCDQLDNEQLEAIGDYYMEQMHPGEAHEIMDRMMGGEGSESLKQAHINMARRLYCNEDVYPGYGMMGSGGMMSMMGGGRGGNGMMNGQNVQGSMMGNRRSGFGYGNFIAKKKVAKDEIGDCNRDK